MAICNINASRAHLALAVILPNNILRSNVIPQYRRPHHHYTPFISEIPILSEQFRLDKMAPSKPTQVNAPEGIQSPVLSQAIVYNGIVSLLHPYHRPIQDTCTATMIQERH